MRYALLLCCLLRVCFAQTLHGRVTGAHGEPVAGATVRVLNTVVEATTGADGRFTLAVGAAAGGVGRTAKAPPDGAARRDAASTARLTLYVTAPGYASRIVSGDSLDISLAPAIRQLDDIVVSAGKKEENSRDLPLSLTTLNAAAAERLWAMEDLRDEVSNLYAAGPGDGRDVISIRGVTSTSYDPAVTTYVDGVSAMSLKSYIPQLFDVDRIEVLKGPQGTLYGRNALGGVINVITRPPTGERKAFVEADLGNYDQQRYSAGLQLPVVRDRLFLSAAVLYEGRHGFYTNDYTHTDFDRQHRFGGNYALRYLAGNHWSVEGTFKHLENRNNGAFPLMATPGMVLAHPYHVDQNAVTTMVDNTVNASLAARYAGPRFTFSTQTAYASNYRIYQQPIDGDFSPVDAITLINNYGKPWNKVSNVTEELRFGSAAAARGLKAGGWDWTAGLYGFYQDVPTKQGTHYGKDAALVGSPDSNYAIVDNSTQYGAGLAAYGQVTRHLAHGWSMTAGLRYDYEHNHERVYGAYVPDGGSASTIQPDTAANASYGAFSPMGAIAKTLDPHTSAYARYARGYRTGGLTAISGDPTQPPLYPYKPEYSNNWEAGVKGAYGRVTADIALFYCVINDVQVPTLELPAGVTVTKNAGRLESRGLDADVQALLATGLRLTYGFGLTHATYDKLDLSQNGSAEDLKGKTQVFTPDMTSNLGLQYTVKLDSKWSAHIRGEWIYRGRQYFDLANKIEQGAYQVVNAGAGVAYGDVTLEGWARNLSKTRYIAYAYDFGATHLGDPCTYGVTLRWAGRL
ncbi:TonB-dependent receptor [Dinghuibacter silviterrae]|uniref:Iron complex outermembrane receptor protein n=1 Tax=Dinghuibacter silviterrae TaxID=1539049 RepID=A0A4R8DVA4_9BACT|nr:TonB-dependent receptor [Dinghuibacter silviterrae]TDX02352.1 iron complex outermembrane receptor protein [Dinghuibacter silviterrae]